MSVFCDWLSVTVQPQSFHALHGAVIPLLLDSGATFESEGLYSCGSYGKVHAKLAYRVGCFTASGGALAFMRDSGVYPEYLRAISEYPHRVTRLDATLDVPCDSPKVLRCLYRKACRGEVGLSRKLVPPSGVSTIWGPGCVDTRETGTVYLGSPRARVRAVVYDKRNQLVSRGDGDPGPLLRYEVRVRGDLGPTLRDAWEPSALFYHFVSPDLLPCPAGMSVWHGHAEGFDMPVAEDIRTPSERLMQSFMDSNQVGAYCTRAVELYGEQAEAVLMSWVRKRVKIARASGQFVSMPAQGEAQRAGAGDTTH